MKINWGTGIAIFYTCFVAAMIFMVIKSSQNQSHLVQENYYDKDLNYEEFRLKRQNAAAMDNPVEIKYMSVEKNILLSFPTDISEVSGKVALFRPSNKYMDKTYELKLNNLSQMEIPVDNRTMPAGLWRVQIDWQSKGKQYYNEENIVL